MLSRVYNIFADWSTKDFQLAIVLGAFMFFFSYNIIHTLIPSLKGMWRIQQEKNKALQGVAVARQPLLPEVAVPHRRNLASNRALATRLTGSSHGGENRNETSPHIILENAVLDDEVLGMCGLELLQSSNAATLAHLQVFTLDRFNNTYIGTNRQFCLCLG